jgi:Helix-turn-helix domain
MSLPNKVVAEKVAWLVFSHPHLAKPGDVAVAMTIASFANGRGNAWPSNATISKRAHVGHTFVSGSIERLKVMGILDWVDRTARGESNLYTIHALVGITDPPSSAKRIGNKTMGHGNGSTETAEQRVRRENRERNERRHQEQEAKERDEAADPAELEQLRNDIMRRARASGTLVGG